MSKPDTTKRAAQAVPLPEVPGYGIKFTIPDRPAPEQLEMVKGLKESVQALADLAGEPLDAKPFDDVIAKLEAKIAVNDLQPLVQEATTEQAEAPTTAIKVNKGKP